MGSQLSAEFTLERGVLQGSVLSPVLFLLVMDPLLRELERNSLGPFVYGTYAGAFAYADDIHTVTSSLPSLQQQINMVQNFAEENALTLNPAKCEVLIVSSTKPVSSMPVCTLADQSLLPKESVNALDIGSHGISQPPKLSTKPSRKPEGPSSPMGQWEPTKANQALSHAKQSSTHVLFLFYSLEVRTGSD